MKLPFRQRLPPWPSRLLRSGRIQFRLLPLLLHYWMVRFSHSKDFPCFQPPFLNLSFGKLTNIIDNISGSCITYVMPGGVPFSSVSCSDNPTTISIQTSYNGGPANQQVPMPYTDYVVAASSAASASSAAAEASSNANSESSSS